MRWSLVVSLLTPAASAAIDTADKSGGFFDDLLRSYTPRRVCMNNEASVIWLHVISDLLITVAYFSIPVALIVFVRRRTDLAFNWMFKMFAMFIFACGMTHLVGVWDIWQPLYKIDGLVKLYTGLVSAATAVLLWRLIPTAVALPSPRALAVANTELARMRDDLEVRVADRTRDLALATERERLARTEAERANRSKDDFLAILSHELRTPLSAILGWTHLLTRENLDQAERHRGVEVIERNARMQAQLIDDLLDMSRINAGKLRLDVQSMDLASVIDDAVETVTPAATAKGIRLQKVLDPKAGQVRGDRDRLQQVMWNLLSNAVKFAPKGGRIAVFLERVNSHVEISVVDTGAGISAELLPHIFDRFRQVDVATTRRQGGLGLGLAIVRNLVELHGGTVRAESPGKGSGSTFRVLLPLTPVQPPSLVDEPRYHPTARVADVPAPAPDTGQLRGLRLLVVDDEPDARQLFTLLFEGSGATVFTASSAQEALDVLQQVRPDVLISDIGMPEEDGLSLMRKVRHLPPDEGGNAPALALTAFARPEDRRLALQSGFDMHLAKPVDPAELVLMVANLARRAQA